MSELMWVAVPGGFEDGQALLRVLVVPRLDGGSLADAGMKSWPPASLLKATLTVGFAQSVDGAVAPVEVAPPHVSVQEGAWDAFFDHPQTTVRPARSTGAPVPEVQVEDTATVAKDVKETFEAVAGTRVAAESASRSDLDWAVRKELDARWTGEGPVRPAPAPLPPGDAPDFHRTISLLREHPAVLQALGLVFELKLTIPADHPEGLVRVEWRGAARKLPPIVSPWTAYGREFRPASTENVSAGMVTLTEDRSGGASRWDVVTVDVDGGAARLREAARSLGSSNAPASLPALRTAGLVLVRPGRHEDFQARRNRAVANADRGSTDLPPLTADDLVLGYRIDVSPFGSNAWLSLHQRDARYTVGDVTIGPGREEGHIKAHAAAAMADDTRHADEVVGRWAGWSLAVPLPQLLTGSAGPPPGGRPDVPYDFDWEFDVPPKSLPRLRFGSTYRVRARVHDMAGGGLAVDDDAANRCVTEPVRYLRYEPVAAPAITLPDGVAVEALGPAESAHEVVVRSDVDMTPAQFAAAHPAYASNLVRLLLPPGTSLAVVEQHGELDHGTDEETFALVRRAMAAANGGPPLSDPAAGGVTAFPLPRPGDVSASLAESSWPTPWPDLGSKSLELTGEQGAAKPVAWKADRLNVRLAQGEQVTIELSSFPPPDFLDRFAIAEPLPDESENAANLGRHPMLTPATPVRLVHAVRRPLAVPGATLGAKREPGQTFALLEPDRPLLGADAKSTGKLEVTAAWTDQIDDRQESLADVPVQSVLVDRGDMALADVLRHELGDTRHRNVAYTFTAVSRFRSYFRPDEPDEAFVATSAPGTPVVIPSSARPAPATVISTRPAFAWDTQTDTDARKFSVVRRVRAGGRLRVELGRPWFLTGEGERLAVVASTSPAPSQTLRQFVAQAAGDPIWTTPAPERWLRAETFAATSEPPAEVLLTEAGERVMAVPYEAWFSDDGRLFADVALPSVAASSYCPFVRLGVARFQRHSLADLELSSVALTELVPLLPERTLTVRRLGADVVATLGGLGPNGPALNRVDVVLERCTLPPGAAADRVELTAPEAPADGTPAWVPVADQARQGALGTDLSLRLPADPGAFRVRVREVELVGPAGDPPRPGSAAELTERTVFTDVVAVP